MNASRTPPAAPSPYTSRGPGSPLGLPWHRVLVRVVLVVVLGQIVGALIASVAIGPVDLRAHPGATALFWVLPGLVAGVGVGLLLGRDRARPWGRLGLAAAVGAVSYLLLVALGHTRAGGSAALLTPGLFAALLGCVALQTVVGAGLLLLRQRRPR